MAEVTAMCVFHRMCDWLGWKGGRRWGGVSAGTDCRGGGGGFESRWICLRVTHELPAGLRALLVLGFQDFRGGGLFVAERLILCGSEPK